MSTYKIRIEKITSNPEFKQEKEDFMAGYRMGERPRYDPIPPREEITKDVLVAELTEDEFKKVKSEIIKVFE